MQPAKINILGISGSLRNTSSNTVIIKAIGRMLPDFVDYIISDDIGNLPHFNDTDNIPDSVVKWRDRITAADGIIICSPEYAFGIPGTLKNALDWTVGSGEFVNKKLALITAASVGDKAHAALLNVLTAISCDLAPNRTLLVPFVKAKLNNGAIIDSATKTAMQDVVDALINATLEK